MPVFDSIDEAIRYLKIQTSMGMACTQAFTTDGRIAVECKLAPPPAKQRKLYVAPEPDLFAPPPPPEQQTSLPIKEPETIEEITLPHELRDYQREAVEFAMVHKHVLIELPTGRGKSLTAIAIVNEIVRENIGLRTIVVVPTRVLIEQWIADGFQAAGLTATGVSGEGKVFSKQTVITYQSAINYLPMFSQYDIIIFDEVHHLFSPQFSKILYAVANKRYLIGLTATVREMGAGARLQQQYFPHVYTKSLRHFQASESRIPLEIVEQPVSFSSAEASEYDDLQTIMTRANRLLGAMPDWPRYVNSTIENQSIAARSGLKAYAAQKKLLTELPEKLKVIKKLLEVYAGQFVIFSDTIAYIKEIEKMLQSMGVSAGAIYSGVSAKERTRVIQGLKDKSIRVLIGGQAITEGLDMPDMSNAILASLLVSSSRTYVQRIGRVLRPGKGKHVRVFLIYVARTKEETNAYRIRQMLGELE